MNIDFNNLEKRVISIVVALPEEIDRSWLIAVFLSLRKAYELNYQRDDISLLNKADQNNLLLRITAFNFNSFKHSTSEEKIWAAGYFFNNAMFRMVALTEIGLKLLKKLQNKKNKGKHTQLSKWYEETFQQKLTNIENARKRVISLKHHLRNSKGKKSFEGMSEGVVAFNELLTLMEHISTSNNAIQQMRNTPC
jgi:hypothetical protein